MVSSERQGRGVALALWVRDTETSLPGVRAERDVLGRAGEDSPVRREQMLETVGQGGGQRAVRGTEGSGS